MINWIEELLRTEAYHCVDCLYLDQDMNLEGWAHQVALLIVEKLNEDRAGSSTNSDSVLSEAN